MSDRDIEDTRQPMEYPTCRICDSDMERDYFGGWYCQNCEQTEDNLLEE